MAWVYILPDSILNRNLRQMSKLKVSMLDRKLVSILLFRMKKPHFERIPFKKKFICQWIWQKNKQRKISILQLNRKNAFISQKYNKDNPFSSEGE